MLSEHGTALAQTRTRPFDAVPFEEFRVARGSFVYLLTNSCAYLFFSAPTRLTQSFVRQGARMFLNAPR